jgi:hypothetical protein
MLSGLKTAVTEHLRRMVRLPWYAIIAAVFVAAACATTGGNSSRPKKTEDQRAQEIVPMLQTAGFDPVVATTPAQIERLKSLPPLKLGYYIDQKGDANYWMADPDYCQCIMHGDEAAYQRYENLKLENETAERDRRAVQALQRRQQQQMMIGPPAMGFGFGNGSFSGGGFGLGGGGFGIAF